MTRAGKLLLLGLVVLLLPACNRDSEQAAWERVTSSDGRFKAEFPVKPIRQTQRVPAPGSPLELVVYTAEVDNEAVSVSFIDYAVEPAGEDLQKVLDSAAEGASSAIQGQNLSKESTTFLGRESVDFTVDSAPNQLTGRAVLVGSRMYLLQVVHLKSVQSPSFERLASSFELIPGPTPTPSPSPVDVSPAAPIFTP